MPQVLISFRRDLRLVLRDLDALLAYVLELEHEVESMVDAWLRTCAHLFERQSVPCLQRDTKKEERHPHVRSRADARARVRIGESMSDTGVGEEFRAEPKTLKGGKLGGSLPLLAAGGIIYQLPPHILWGKKRPTTRNRQPLRCHHPLNLKEKGVVPSWHLITSCHAARRPKP